jgi:hypothetical protein
MRAVAHRQTTDWDAYERDCWQRSDTLDPEARVAHQHRLARAVKESPRLARLSRRLARAEARADALRRELARAMAEAA